MSNCNHICNSQLAELELRRQIEDARRSLAYYTNANEGGKYGHGRGNFAGRVAQARGALQAAEHALQTITGRR